MIEVLQLANRQQVDDRAVQVRLLLQCDRAAFDREWKDFVVEVLVAYERQSLPKEELDEAVRTCLDLHYDRWLKDIEGGVYV